MKLQVNSTLELLHGISSALRREYEGTNDREVRSKLRSLIASVDDHVEWFEGTDAS